MCSLVFFVINVLVTVFVIAPMEKKIGSAFHDPQAANAITKADLGSLYSYHVLSLGIAGFIGFTQAMAYAAHNEDIAAATAAAAAAEKDKKD